MRREEKRRSRERKKWRGEEKRSETERRLTVLCEKLSTSSFDGLKSTPFESITMIRFANSLKRKYWKGSVWTIFREKLLFRQSSSEILFVYQNAAKFRIPKQWHIWIISILGIFLKEISTNLVIRGVRRSSRRIVSLHRDRRTQKHDRISDRFLPNKENKRKIREVKKREAQEKQKTRENKRREETRWEEKEIRREEKEKRSRSRRGEEEINKRKSQRFNSFHLWILFLNVVCLFFFFEAYFVDA